MAQSGFQVAALAGAERYDRNTELFMYRFADALLDAAAPADDDRVLDVACGTGLVGRRLGRAVTGVDLNPAMLDVAARRAPDSRWLRGSATQLPLRTDGVDVAVCNQGFQFFPDATAAAAEWARVLRPGGRAAATIWAGPERCPYFAAQRAGLEATVGPAVTEAFRGATPDDPVGYLSRAFTAGGLTDIDVRTVEIEVDLPPLDGFVPEQVRGTPWGPAFDELDPADQQRVTDTVRDRLGDARRVPFVSVLVTARA